MRFSTTYPDSGLVIHHNPIFVEPEALKSVSLKIVCLTLSVLLLGACAGRDRQPIYLQSEEVEPIRVPEHLDEPAVRQTYRVAGYFLPEMAGQGDARPPRVLSSAEAEASRSHIRFGDRGLYLEVEDEVDSVWRRLGFSLDRGGMQIRDADETQRQYDFRFEHEPIVIDRSGLSRLAFWRGEEKIDHGGHFRVELEPAGGDITRVILLDESGELVEMERAEFLLSELRERLG